VDRVVLVGEHVAEREPVVGYLELDVHARAVSSLHLDHPAIRAINVLPALARQQLVTILDFLELREPRRVVSRDG
jgi:hypothetical protein